jgi:hypothetical protein
LASNFDGLSDTQNKAIAGFHDTPPDQGLCVGFLGSTKVVIEAVNSIFGIYTTGGTLLASFPVTVGFLDPNAFSDPRCFYDTSTHSFYMTVISCFSCATDTFDDVLVVNSSGLATTYQFDTSVGGTCFGDQPHTGYDSHALYITTGSGVVTLNGRIIGSETYAFPMPAASTGTGAVDVNGITSEAFLNPDDSRMQQVQLVNDDQHGLQLYAAPLTSRAIRPPATAPHGSSSIRRMPASPTRDTPPSRVPTCSTRRYCTRPRARRR